MNSEKIVPVILCGGVGSRLWPISRESFPKQFINLKEGSDKTLLQNTYERLSSLSNLDNPILICNEEHRFITAEQTRELKVIPKSILLEPEGKGTAPAAALAAIKATEKGENPYLLILSSDHIIENESKFIKSIKKGLDYAEKGRLVTFGVLPDSPETGYGYIESKEALDKNLAGSNITRFIEKPNLKTAKVFFSDKHFSWNSGIFLFKAFDILKELESYEPNIVKNCRQALSTNEIDFDFQRINKLHFSKCKNISIDIAIMEKTKLGTVIPLIAGWKDIGSWEHVWESSEKDINFNSSKGKVFLKDCKNSYFKSDGRLLVGIGVADLITIETSDAVLVMNKNKSQDIKETVELLKKNNFKESIEHQKIFRPWGSYTSLVEDKNWKVKKIVVNPNQSLSLQLHHKRAENWIVVSGIAKVEIDNKTTLLHKNHSAFIPKKTKHRLSNPNDEPLILIEIQSGELIDEMDIVRFKDNYGRIEKSEF
tara:strand:+ start:356 stop:1804 length:1449 start_codon:yes stop_codon:yes gene_type:complete